MDRQRIVTRKRKQQFHHSFEFGSRSRECIDSHGTTLAHEHFDESCRSFSVQPSEQFVNQRRAVLQLRFGQTHTQRNEQLLGADDDLRRNAQRAEFIDQQLRCHHHARFA
jgi:hypothetical protein